MSLCVVVIGLILLVALIFVSLPAFALVAVGCLAMWYLQWPDKGDTDDKRSLEGVPRGHVPDDDTLSVDSGILSAQDFTMGVVKDKLVQPHSQPPIPPVAEVSAFRTIKATTGVERNDPMYENYNDADLFEQRMNRGHEASLRHLYTNGLNRAMGAARKELPLKDPNLIPIDPSEQVGCPRPLGKI